MKSFNKLLSKKNLQRYQRQNSPAIMNAIKLICAGFLFTCIAACETGHGVCAIDSSPLSVTALAERMHHGLRLYVPVDVYIDCLIFEVADPEVKKVIVCSVDPDKLTEEFNQLNLSFSDLNIEFVIRNIIPVTQELCVNSAQEFEEKWQAAVMECRQHDGETFCNMMANIDKSTCSLFVQFDLGPNISGLSKLPYWENCRGVRVCGPRLERYLLAHEFGHYFGLMHTFHPGGDNINDTPDGPGDIFLAGTTADPNCNNIMTYTSDDSERNFTPGQINMMRRFCMGFRVGEIYSSIPYGCNRSENLSNLIRSMLENL
jgi:hypothetical protein